jgi:hypothetical protein
MSDGSVLPKSQWSGYIVDMIAMVADKAGFTYELFTPSGRGYYCSGDGTLWGEDYVGQYNCGQGDVLNDTILADTDYGFWGGTHAYWSMYYITPSRMSSNTTFTLPFLTNVGLGMLQLKPSPSLLDSMLLIFKPFAIEMWGVTIALVAFAAVIVWCHELVQMPSRKADTVISKIHDQVNRLDSVKLEELLVRGEGVSAGVYSMKALFRFPTYIAGTFGGLFTASDDSEADTEERVTPSGNFAAAWGFFVLLWSASYVANLAAIMTTNSYASQYSTLEDLAGAEGTACASSGAAYTSSLISSFPALTVKEYSSLADMVVALEDGSCDAIVQSQAAVEAIAMGAVDLDSTSSKRFCPSDGYSLYLVPDPRPIGYTDMAVGVGDSFPELREVISYWISELRTCNPYSTTSECYQGGTSSGLNFEYLREQHVDLENCGNPYSTDSGTGGMGVENFLVPILVLLLVGLVTLYEYHSSYLSKFSEYSKHRDLPDLLLSNIHYDSCFEEHPITIEGWNYDEDETLTTKVLMLDLLFGVLASQEELRIKVLKSALKYFLRNDMECFFLLARLGHIEHPNSEFSDKYTAADMRKASLMKKEVSDAIDVLLVRAIRESFLEGDIEHGIFVCKDDAQLSRMKRLEFGMRKSIISASGRNLPTTQEHDESHIKSI